MSSNAAFFGYIGQVWTAALGSIQFLQKQLASAPVAASTEAIAIAVFETVINALHTINGARYLDAWRNEAATIGTARALAITFDPAALGFLNQRSRTYAVAATALSAALPSAPFPAPSSMLPQGSPTIPDPDLIGFFQRFNYEVAPGGLSPGNLADTSQAAATAFGMAADEVQAFEGVYLTQGYDALRRLQLTQQAATNTLRNITSSSISTSGFVASNPVSGLWNQMAVLPPMLMDAALVSSAPYSLPVQQACVMRNALLTVAKQLAVFLLVLRQPVANKINLAKVLAGDNLMDVAARSLGNFEQWSEIAKVNNLEPPYLGNTSSPGVAAFGSQLIMPTAGARPSPIGAPPSYETNFLGVDLYVGPINQPMPPWGGDFQTISGYQNLAWALGRRVQTAIGLLIYHGDYGSRVPGEVGTVQTAAEAGRVAAFGKSALLSDPRVARVLKATATIADNGLVSFTGTVQPKGFGTTLVDVNVTIPGG